MARSDIRFPPIDALRAFEAATRLGAFDKVAVELAVSASAVSKRVSALEHLLGTALFDRNGRHLALTAAGKEYAEQVRAVLNQLAAIGLHQRAVQSIARLRVLAPPTFAREVLVPRLKAFSDAWPDAEIEIVVAIPYLDLAVPEADIAVSFGPPGIAESLLFEPVFAVAAPALVRQFGLKRPADLVRKAADAEDTGTVRLIRCPLEPWRPWFSAAGIEAPEPTRGVKFVDLGLSLEAAASGQGVALARMSLAARWIARGELVAYSPCALCRKGAIALSCIRPAV